MIRYSCDAAFCKKVDANFIKEERKKIQETLDKLENFVNEFVDK